MMVNFEELTGRLMVIKERCDNQKEIVARESQYLNETSEKIRVNFGNQQPGVQAGIEIYHMINALATVDSQLNAVISRLTPYIMKIKNS